MKYQTQLEKSTKNNYKYAAIAAVALVALLIPAGIFAGDYLDVGPAISISKTDGLNHLASQANSNGNYPDGRYYAGQALQSDPNSITAIIHLRESYPHLEQYSSLLSIKNSIITIDPSGKIMFFPNKDKAGFVIPEINIKNASGSLDTDGSLQLDYPGIIPIVYPIDEQYPAVIFDRNNLDAHPMIISPNNPNYLEILSSIDPQKSIIVQPVYRTDPENTIVYAETPLGGPNDPIIIHPFGFGDGVPVIVFPIQESAATIILTGDGDSNESAQSQNPNGGGGSTAQVYRIFQTQTVITPDVLATPILYTTVELSEIPNVPGNLPVRVFVDGSDNPPVKFPLGIDFRPIINPTVSPQQQPVPDTPQQQPSPSIPSVPSQSSVSNPTSSGYLSPSDFESYSGFQSYLQSLSPSEFQSLTRLSLSYSEYFSDIELQSYLQNVNVLSLRGQGQGNYQEFSLQSKATSQPISNSPNFTEGITLAFTGSLPSNIILGPGFNDPMQGMLSEELLAKAVSEAPFLAEPFTEDMFAALDIVPDGDPIAFSLNGDDDDENDDATTCTIRREMGSHESSYWKFNLYATDPPIMLNMNRNLCDGTYILGIDRNNNGILDSGYEIMWLRDFDAFQLLHNIDYYEGVYDGFFNSEDPLWTDALVMDSDYNYHHPEELGIKAVGYYSQDIQRFADDQYGVGVYADEVNVSDHHFRIMTHAPTAIVLDDNSTTEAFGIVEGPLWDCTIHDVRYHVAEKMTGEYLRIDTPEDSTQLYIDALDFCDDFETANKHPDKYLSHWIAGIASMQHKKGLTDYNMLLQSKQTYEEALTMSPDNPFYNVDYCLVNNQLGYPTDECIPKVQQAIENRPDVAWFQQVHMILTGDMHMHPE